MASREGYDLFTYSGWYVLAKNYRQRWFRWRVVFEDTFIQLWCMIVGHDEYNASDSVADPYEYNSVIKPVELACKRCHKYIKDRNYHILCRRIMGQAKWI